MLTKKEVSRIINHFGEGKLIGIDKDMLPVIDVPPVFIGDVMEKMITPNREGVDFMSINELILVWLPFKFTKSLQEIVDKSGWERKVFCACGEELKKDEPHECRTIGKPTFTEQLKSPQARELFGFLNTLIK